MPSRNLDLRLRGPEQSIVKTQIKIMDLITEVGGGPPHVEVNSNEGKRALTVPAVSSDIFAGHEAHVGVKD